MESPHRDQSAPQRNSRGILRKIRRRVLIPGSATSAVLQETWLGHALRGRERVLVSLVTENGQGNQALRGCLARACTQGKRESTGQFGNRERPGKSSTKRVSGGESSSQPQKKKTLSTHDLCSIQTLKRKTR